MDAPSNRATRRRHAPTLCVLLLSFFAVPGRKEARTDRGRTTAWPRLPTSPPCEQKTAPPQRLSSKSRRRENHMSKTRRPVDVTSTICIQRWVYKQWTLSAPLFAGVSYIRRSTRDTIKKQGVASVPPKHGAIDAWMCELRGAAYVVPSMWRKRGNPERTP